MEPSSVEIQQAMKADAAAQAGIKTANASAQLRSNRGRVLLETQRIVARQTEETLA
jgi:hypothetical protein